jgi:hypothetical protein
LARALNETRCVSPNDALRYLAGRPMSVGNEELDGRTAVRLLAEVGLSEVLEPLARGGRDEHGWFLFQGQVIESDVRRMHGWCGATDVELRPRKLRVCEGSGGANLFERAIAHAGFVEPVPFVDWWTILPSLAQVYTSFARVVNWRFRLGLVRPSYPKRASDLVLPKTTARPFDDQACSVLVAALFLWTSTDIPYVQNGLVGLGEKVCKRAGSAAVRGMFRMRECAERAGAWECMRALDEWLARRSRDVGDTPYDVTSLPPHAGAMRLVHAVPYGVDSVIGALGDAEVEDPRDVHFALEVALETGQVEAGRLIADAYLPKITHVVADRPRGSNAVDVVELAGMLCDAGGDVDAGTRLFRRALEMPVWGGTRFRTWWLRQRIERGPRFFFDSRWSVVPMGR